MGSMESEVKTWVAQLTLPRGGSRPMKGPQVCHLAGCATDSVRRIATADGMFRCPLCPLRVFHSPNRVRHRLHTKHAQRSRWCASGRKQLRMAVALRDDDLFRGKLADDLLQRSALLMRQMLPRTMRCTSNVVDADIRWMLDVSGPHLVCVADGLDDLLCVGNLYVHQRLGSMVLRLACVEGAFLPSYACSMHLRHDGSRQQAVVVAPLQWQTVVGEASGCPDAL